MFTHFIVKSLWKYALTINWTTILAQSESLHYNLEHVRTQRVKALNLINEKFNNHIHDSEFIANKLTYGDRKAKTKIQSPVTHAIES